MKIKLTLFLSACCVMGAAFAADLVVDNYERLSVVATNGDVTADSIFSAPKAVAIEKTGTDALTLAANAVQTRDAVPVRVLEGTLNVVPGADPGLEQPACLQRAALWLDASRACVSITWARTALTACGSTACPCRASSTPRIPPASSPASAAWKCARRAPC